MGWEVQRNCLAWTSWHAWGYHSPLSTCAAPSSACLLLLHSAPLTSPTHVALTPQGHYATVWMVLEGRTGQQLAMKVRCAASAQPLRCAMMPLR